MCTAPRCAAAGQSTLPQRACCPRRLLSRGRRQHTQPSALPRQSKPRNNCTIHTSLQYRQQCDPQPPNVAAARSTGQSMHLHATMLCLITYTRHTGVHTNPPSPLPNISPCPPPPHPHAPSHPVRDLAHLGPYLSPVNPGLLLARAAGKKHSHWRRTPALTSYQDARAQQQLPSTGQKTEHAI